MSEIIIYTTQDNKTKISLKVEGDTVWLNQNQLAELFDTTKQNISLHIKNIIESNELNIESTVKKYLTVQNEGNREISREIEYYNLDMILAIGYRVRSVRGIQFRNWASERLKEYLIKGFTMDDERLKNPKESDYFRELLSRIKDIRSSEARFYQQVKDIYSLSADYDKNSEQAKLFFKTVQNKMLFAITGKTASELICDRNTEKSRNFGLQTWKNSPDGKISKLDMQIAKNYLNEPELKELNNIVSMFLDYAEMQAEKRQLMYMKDWEEILNKFLKFNDKELLENAGKLSHDFMINYIDRQYNSYKKKIKEEKNKNEIEELKKYLKNN